MYAHFCFTDVYTEKLTCFSKGTNHVSPTERSYSFCTHERSDIFSFKIEGLNEFKGRMMYAHFCFTTEKLPYFNIRLFRPVKKCHFFPETCNNQDTTYCLSIYYSKIFDKYAVLCVGNVTNGTFSILIFPWSNQFRQ